MSTGFNIEEIQEEQEVNTAEEIVTATAEKNDPTLEIEEQSASNTMKPSIITKLGTLMILYYGYKILWPLIKGEPVESENVTLLWIMGTVLALAGVGLAYWIIREELQERRRK